MKSLALSGGIALFAMLFGAGNIAYPLVLGRDASSMVLITLVGFVITAILVPIVGLIGSMLFDADYNAFFNRVGVIPGRFLVGVCMLLLTVGVSRCVVTSHGALAGMLNEVSLFTFSAVAIALIFMTTYRKAKIVDLLGYVFGPLKILLLLTIVFKGFFSRQPFIDTGMTASGAFANGITTGFSTFDLIGTIFFSTLVLSYVRAHYKDASLRQIAVAGIQAGLIGGVLLGIVYAGFCFDAAMYAPELAGLPKQLLFPRLAELILGRAGILANLTVAVSCFATSIALTAVVTDYMRAKVLHNRVGYIETLCAVLAVAFGLSILGFSKIDVIAFPIVAVCYPAFLVLAICNIAYKLVGFKTVRIPFYAVTLIAAIFYLHGAYAGAEWMCQLHDFCMSFIS